MKYLEGFFPPNVVRNSSMHKHMLKEYIQVLMLDYLSTSTYISKIAFIGGTNLRLLKKINRFSEDLDFDCKNLSESDFMAMTDSLIENIRDFGLNVETRDKESPRLQAFRRNLYFPQFLFDMRLTGHREERFLVKIEAQDQGVDYERQIVDVNNFGFSFPLPVPPDSVLLSMKLAALLSRGKGRDFYDVMFLFQQTLPDYTFLNQRIGISSPTELLEAVERKLNSTDLELKCRDFEHLLFNRQESARILRFHDYVKERLCQ